MTNTAKLGAIAAFWVAVGLVQTFNWEGGVLKAIVLFALLLSVPFVMAAARRDIAPMSPAWQRGVTIAAIVWFVLDLIFLAIRIRNPHILDIGTTTLDAGNAVLSGGNPYTLPIDTGPQSVGFTGYKYLPLMFATYLPLGLWLDQRGLLLTNLVLLLGCVWFMRRLTKSDLAPLLLLMLPIVPEQIFAKGATDLVAVLPLLAGLFFFGRSAFLTGFCVGLSIAAKLLPGVMFLPCLLPSQDRAKYLAGVVVGLMPTVPFLIASPRAFLDNTVFFAMAKLPDTTAWLSSVPSMVADLAHLVLLGGFIWAAAHVWRRAPSLAARCGIGTMLVLGAILAGPGAHHNYQLWWMPFYAVILSLALTGDETCQRGAGRDTNPASIPFKS